MTLDTVIRPHRQHAVHRCGLLLLHIMWSVFEFVCLCVLGTHELCTDGWTDRDAVCGTEARGPKELCVRWGSRSSHGKTWTTVRDRAQIKWKIRKLNKYVAYRMAPISMTSSDIDTEVAYATVTCRSVWKSKVKVQSHQTSQNLGIKYVTANKRVIISDKMKLHAKWNFWRSDICFICVSSSVYASFYPWYVISPVCLAACRGETNSTF